MSKLRLFSAFLLGVSILSAWTAFAQEDPDCPGAPLPRLSVGAQARVLPGDANNVRDTASRSGARIGSIPGGEVFNILEGPACADGLNWWRVEYGGLTGWTVEGSGIGYWVEPYEGAAAEPTQQPAPAPTTAPVSEIVRSFEPPIKAVNRLEVGVQARVINDDPESDTVTLTVRAEPGRSGASLAQAVEGDLLAIIGGPEEADGLRWWQVETAKGTRGWVIEGLVNPDRSDAYERTLLALCPVEGERVAYRVDTYAVTSAPDGSAACVLDRLIYSGWQHFTYGGSSFDTLLIVSPDGEYVIYAEQLRQNDRRRFSTLYRLKQDGSERLALTRDSDVNWAAWSPDGERIAIATGRQIGIFNADGSAFFGLTQGGPQRSWVTWLPDGQTVIYEEEARREDQSGNFIEYERVFYRIHILDGGLREILRTSLDINNPPKLSPDGAMLAITSRQSLSSSASAPIVLSVVDVETGARIVEHDVGFGNFLWMPDSSALVFVASEGSLKVIPVNGDEAYVVELTGEFPSVHDWNFLRWETDTGFLVAVGHGFRIGTDDLGIWAVDLTSGAVERR